ncbi:hypothetical protein R0K19_25140, partial [Bacillus sp. SIMBA_161]
PSWFHRRRRAGALTPPAKGILMASKTQQTVNLTPDQLNAIVAQAVRAALSGDEAVEADVVKAKAKALINSFCWSRQT